MLTEKRFGRPQKLSFNPQDRPDASHWDGENEDDEEGRLGAFCSGDPMCPPRKESEVDVESAGLVGPEVRHRHTTLGKGIRAKFGLQMVVREMVARSIPLPSLRPQAQMASISQSL